MDFDFTTDTIIPTVGTNINISSTGSFSVPTGTTAQQPAAVNGMLRYDTDTNKLRAVESGVWTNVIGGGGGAPTTAQYVVLALDGTLSAERVLTGTANQITITDGGANGNVTLAIASNVNLPGTGGMMVPVGTTAQRIAAADGELRYNTDENIFEGAVGYPAGAFATYAGLQKSIMYRKRAWLMDEFVGTFPATSDTDAYGQLGWHSVSNGTSANIVVAASTDHLGIWGLVTGAISGNDVRITLGVAATSGVVMANQVEYFAFLIRIPTITTMSIKVGLGQDMSDVAQGTYGTNGVWFEFFPATNAALRFYTRSASTSSTPTATVTVAGNTWYLCEAFYDGTTWTPRVNGTNYTGIAANVPTTAVNVGAIVETLTTAARTLELDRFELVTRELGVRY